MHRQIGLRDEQSASCIVHHVRHHVHIKVVLPRSFGTSWGSTASMTRSTAPAGSRSCGLGNKFQGVVSGVVGRSMPLTRPGNCVAGCTNPSKRLTNWENTSTPLHPHYPSLIYPNINHPAHPQHGCGSRRNKLAQNRSDRAEMPRVPAMLLPLLAMLWKGGPFQKTSLNHVRMAKSANCICCSQPR